MTVEPRMWAWVDVIHVDVNVALVPDGQFPMALECFGRFESKSMRRSRSVGMSFPSPRQGTPTASAGSASPNRQTFRSGLITLGSRTFTEGPVQREKTLQ